MSSDLVLTQKKIIKFVKDIFFQKKNSPFLKKNYFALYEDGGGSKLIKEEIFKVKNNFFKDFLLKNLYLIDNINFKIDTNSKKFFFKNLIITWGNKSSFLNDGNYYDKYFSTLSSKYKNTFWIVIVNEKIKLKKKQNNLAIIYPNKNIFNYIKFLKIFILNFLYLIFKSNNKIIDQDFILSSYINEFIFNKFSNLENLLMPYEGQAFQKKVFNIQKKNNNNLKTYGFDHSAPHSLATQLYYTDGSPDKLFVTGLNTKKSYSKFYGWPIQNIEVTYPLRYKNLKKNSFSNKMFLPYDFNHEEEILYNFNFFLNKKSNKSLSDFLILIHPEKKNDTRHIKLKEKLEKIKSNNKIKFSKKITTSLTIVVGFTTTPLVALEFKSSVLHICPNPSFDIYLNYFWPNIKIKKINRHCYIYRFDKSGKYLNFNSSDKIKKIINE